MLAIDRNGTPATPFHAELIGRGLLTATGVAGVYGRSDLFEDTVTRVDRMVASIGAGDHPDVVRFPPVLNRTHFERSGYLDSFPHLAGTVHAFAGSEHAHREVLESAHQGGDWSATFPATAVVLAPAACYPVYPMLADAVLPPRGRLIDVMSYCFRHEPSDDPARMQSFRMHEHVRAGDEESVLEWRERWIPRAEAFTAVLGLDGRVELANDPFFGRGGTLLAVNQRDRRLKLEVVVPIASEECLTPIISLNYHQDHFGSAFGIATASGGPAHTACVGFGLERIALALFRRHGFDRPAWPAAVRRELGL
jgi:seryl-tRNA synthetase